MWIIRLIRSLVSLYTLAMIIDLIWPYLIPQQNRFSAALHQICESGRRIGAAVVGKLFPGKNGNPQTAQIAGILTGFVLSVILGWLA